MEIHINCAELDLSTEDSLICLLCIRGKNIIDTQNDCYVRQKNEAEKMKTFSEENFQVLNTGDCITLSVPTVDRGPLDFNNICGVITCIKNDLYQVGTKDGLVKGWFPRTEILKSGSNSVKVNDVPMATILSLREAAAKQSVTGGQGYKKCSCKASKVQCKTK